MTAKVSRRAILAALTPAEAIAAEPASPPLPPPLSQLGGLPLALPDGAPTTLDDALGPGAAVISFWATWCTPCLREARHLSGLRARHPPERLNILGINVDRDRNEQRIAEFLNAGRVNFTQMRGDGATYAAFGQGETILLPRMFVFDATGVAAAAFGRYSGGVTLRAIDRAVDRVLS